MAIYKCSVCDKKLKGGEKAVCFGEVMGLLSQLGSAYGPLKNPKLYCESCFRKQFKKLK